LGDTPATALGARAAPDSAGYAGNGALAATASRDAWQRTSRETSPWSCATRHGIQCRSRIHRPSSWSPSGLRCIPRTPVCPCRHRARTLAGCGARVRP